LNVEMSKEDKLKASKERTIFTKFCKSANLPLVEGSVKSPLSPYPDIKCLLGDKKHFIELVEITDEDMAKSVMKTIKTGKNFE